MKECGANPDLLNAQIGDEGNTKSFADIIKSSIEGINSTYNRGTTEGCKWDAWPWEKGSCIREGISEGVYYLGEGLGHVAATLLTPISEKIAPLQSLINGLPIETNIQNNYNDIQNGFSNGVRAVVNGIGTVVGALINLSANIENLKLSVIQTIGGCVSGQPCSVDQIGNNYNNNHQFLKDKLGWDTGDWKQNATIVATTAVVVAATVLTAGAFGVVAGAGVAFVVGNALAYGAGSIMNGGLLNPQEFLCGDKEANLTECAAYQAGQLATGAIITKAIGAVIPKPAKTVVSNVSKSIDDLKKGAGAVDDIKNKTGGTSNSRTKVVVDGDEYLFDGEFFYKDGKTFTRVLDPDGSLSAAKGKMVEVKVQDGFTFPKDWRYDKTKFRDQTVWKTSDIDWNQKITDQMI